MKIFLNGEEKEVGDDTDMATLLRELELEGKRLAVEVNEELVPRSTFDSHRLKPGDAVEIVRAIGGG